MSPRGISLEYVPLTDSERRGLARMFPNASGDLRCEDPEACEDPAEWRVLILAITDGRVVRVSRRGRLLCGAHALIAGA